MKGTLKRLLIVLIAISMVIMPSSLGFTYADETTGEAVSEETADVAATDGDAVEGPDLSDLSVPRLGEVDPEDLDAEEDESAPISGFITLDELENMNEAELDETVRVSIVLTKAPVLDRYGVEKINSFSAKNYRTSLKNQQAKVEKDINKALGKDINVKWNLTLAVNVMSAELTYRDIKDVLEVKGVKCVQRENRYSALEDSSDTAEPKTALTSEYMVGAQAAWTDGYTGAGQRIAIIDTGADIDHQSFNSDAFDYGIQKYEEKFGKTVDLMEEADIEAVAEELNGAGVYLNSKMPYIYNYVDQDEDVTHVNDSEGEHGSHVSGIAAANRYIPDPLDWGTPEYGSKFVDTLDGVYAVGMAPDAQLLIMKVFGKNGGAYDSDYMAAIEDAIVLDCDACNLSLGSASAGFSYDNVYQDAMNKLTESNTVAAISAGNSYDWAYYNSPYGMLYSDSIIYNTVGSPGSYINSLSVAAAENVGVIGSPLLFGDEKVFYTDTGKTPMSWMDTDYEGNGTEFDFVYIDEKGFEEEYEAVNAEIPLNGKVVLVNRGISSFAEKANNAIPYKPLAGAVVNREPGSISMDLRDFTGNFPFVGINGEDKATIIAAATDSKTFTTDVTYDFDDDGTETTEPQNYTVYTGKVTIVYKADKQINGERENATITDFSSWGVPESLILKPEITAPGGNIYSVNGTATNDDGETTGGTDMYELMSGTSMAAPHIAGLSAVIKQYLEENDLGQVNKELTDNYNLRAIAQSLMMSTATPMIVDDLYLPVIQQGAGLVDISKAINATSVVMIDDAFLTVPTGAAADGKVKVELGDDPDKDGKYSYTFSIYNTTDVDETFELDSTFFTQDLLYDGLFAGNTTRNIDVSERYIWRSEANKNDEHDVNRDGYTDEDDAQAILDYLTGVVDGSALDLNKGEMDEDGKLTTYDAHLLLNWTPEGEEDTEYVVPANGKAEVTVRLTVNEDLSAYPAGAYIEGFTYARCTTTTEEGESLETEHSIPILGFYGNWTDSSMFDYSSKMDLYYYGAENVWESYSGKYSNYFLMKQGPHKFDFTGNPYVPEEEFPYDRLAITSDTQIEKAYYNLIRNSTTTGFAVSALDEAGELDKVVEATVKSNLELGLYTDTSGAQQNTATRKIAVEKTPAEYGFSEGDRFRAGIYAIPEYNTMLYTAEQGDGTMTSAENGYIYEDEDFAAVIESGVLGEGAFLGYDFIVDDTDPVIESVNFDAQAGTVKIAASDNMNLAFVGLISLDGKEFYSYEVPGTAEAEVTLDITDIMGDIPMYAAVFVGDYAGNETSQVLKVNDNTPGYEDPLAPAAIEISAEEMYIYKGNSDVLAAKVIPITATNTDVVWSVADPSIVTVEDGLITGIAKGETDVTATSAADDTISATCHVTVVSVDTPLKAIAWDYKIPGNDNEAVIQLDVSDATKLKDYTVLGDYKGVGTTTALYGYPAGSSVTQGQVYAGTFDYSSGSSDFYKLDGSYNLVDNKPATPELDPYGIGYLPLVDLTLGSPQKYSGYKLFDMAYVYGPYAVLGSANPAIASLFGESEPYVGLPVSIGIHPDYQQYKTYWAAIALKEMKRNIPTYYLLDETGMLWEATTTYVPANMEFVFTFNELFNIGLEPNWLRQSLFYDDSTGALFYSYTDAGANSVLYYIDVEKELVLEIGEYGEEVWPVTGLFTEKAITTADIEEPMDDAEVDMEAVTARVKANMAELEAFRDEAFAEGSDGSLNSVKAVCHDRDTTVDPEQFDFWEWGEYETDGKGFIDMDFSESEPSSNGLATFKYDPEVLKLVGYNGKIDHTSVFVDKENGLIKIAYADANQLEPNTVVENMVFQYVQTCVETELTSTTIERNDNFNVEEEVTTTLSSHNWGDWEYDKENEKFTRTCNKCGEPEEFEFPNRIFGKSRYDTAMEIANEYKELFELEKFESAVVATGDEFPDALTGSYVSIQNDAPMLLINKQDKVKNSVLNYIEANVEEGGTVYLLGGIGAVDKAFETTLAGKGYKVTRLEGKDRFGTNLAILNNAEDPGTELLVCSGLDWPDAATSSATGLPILIVGKQLTANQKAYLEAQNFTDIYVVGGSAVVSDDMLNSLKPYADTVTRVAGANRAETAIAVAEEFYPENLYTLVFADYRNFPDCISGGLLANSLGAPILYGPAYLNTNKAFVEKCEAGDAYVYGGKTLVTTDFFLNAYADMLSWRFGYEQ